MIQFENVSKTYDGSVALKKFSLAVDKGQTVVLLGLSGSGKTTALRMVNGTVTPSEGRVIVRGRDVRDWPPTELRRSIGYVIQEVGLFPHWTVAQNVGLLPKVVGWEPPQICRRVEELLELVRLPYDPYVRRYPSELSGGEAQRVGVARALALQPDLLLMDEPFGALDPITRHHTQTQFLRIKEEQKVTTLFVTHDLQEAFRVGGRIVVVKEGHIEDMGTPESLMTQPSSEYTRELLKSVMLPGPVADRETRGE
ncbi:MAG: ATP-binding cassette domain-containing protein [Fidelibacterota bacterium]